MAKSPSRRNSLSQGCVQQMSLKVFVSFCLPQQILTWPFPFGFASLFCLTPAMCASRFLKPRTPTQEDLTRWSYHDDLSAGARSRTGALSFASAPLFEASRQRLQDRLQANRQRLRVACAHWKLHSQAWKQQGLQQLQRYGSQARPSVLAEATTMQFIRHARQAYQFIPSVAMR